MKAADEFAEAIEYVERRAPLAAKRLAQRIMKRIRSLRRFPNSGGFVPEDELQRYRELIEGNYRIIYRVEGQAVVLMSIYYGTTAPTGGLALNSAKASPSHSAIRTPNSALTAPPAPPAACQPAEWL